MSLINDLIGVVRGVRLVLEAGIKCQQDSTRLIWNNSSIKPLLMTCPTNLTTAFKTRPDLTKELLERSLVVVQGLRQYAVMATPNFDIQKEPTEMDEQMNDEIEELNREFNKTFETLKKVQGSTSTPPFPVDQEYEAPIEQLQKIVRQRDPVSIHTVIERDPVPDTSISEKSTPKPVAKKKLKVSVSYLFYFLSLNLHIMCVKLSLILLNALPMNWYTIKCTCYIILIVKIYLRLVSLLDE